MRRNKNFNLKVFFQQVTKKISLWRTLWSSYKPIYMYALLEESLPLFNYFELNIKCKLHETMKLTNRIYNKIIDGGYNNFKIPIGY